jgi:hypothetical protein
MFKKKGRKGKEKERKLEVKRQNKCKIGRIKAKGMIGVEKQHVTRGEKYKFWKGGGDKYLLLTKIQYRPLV